jgi:hypothetical protein
VIPPRCDRVWEAEAYHEGRLGPKDAESFERHCRTCLLCSEELASNARLRDLARALPDVQPGQLAFKRLRARILRDVTTAVPARSPSSWRRVALAASMGIALAAIAAVVALRASSRTGPQAPAVTVAAALPAVMAGAVAASEGAVWTQAREGKMERVELVAGTLRVHVRPQGPGERFLVRLPDGEVEVRGTTFEVTVRDGATDHVRVDEGTVVLRLRGSPDRSLGPGTIWSTSETSAPGSRAALAAASASAAPTAASAASAAIPRRRSANMMAGDEGAPLYVEAMRSFREGRYDGAAAAFHAFVLTYPKANEAEDASFLEALSLARAGRADAAALAAARHLESFPRSFRRKEASILMARAASHRGRCDEALGVLSPWMSAPLDPEVRSALNGCRESDARP